MNEVLAPEQAEGNVSASCVEIEGLDLDHLEALVQMWLRGRVRDVRLILRNGGLELQGEACSYYAKQLAQHAVMRATPLPIVANAIVVS